MLNNVNTNPAGRMPLANNRQVENKQRAAQNSNTSKTVARTDQVQISPQAKNLLENTVQMQVVQNDVPHENTPNSDGDVIYELTPESLAEREKLKAESMAAMTQKEPGPVTISHRMNIGTQESPMWATIRPNKVFITTGNDPYNLTHTEVDFSKGMPGIDKDTLKMLQFTQMLVQGINNGDTVSSGSSSQILYGQIQRTTLAFGEIYNKAETDQAALQSAFTDMVQAMFDGVAHGEHTDWENTEKMEQVREQARTWADTFLNTFFRDRAEFGADTAFLHAWNQIAYMDMTMPWLNPAQPENE